MKYQLLLLLISSPLYSFAMDLSAPIAPLSTFEYGVAGMQGVRDTMEDADISIVNFMNNPNMAFFGIYDGHGVIYDDGNDANLASSFAANFLHKKLAVQLANKAPVDALIESYLELDKSLFAQNMLDGSTALTALFNANKLWLAWAGDSRAVVVRNGQVIASTTDHKPDNPVERARIEHLGIPVETSPGSTIHRIFGLAVSRALGDFAIKYFSKGAVTAVPDVQEVDLEPGDMVVMGCDGLWDVLNNDMVATFVASPLTETAVTVMAPQLPNSFNDGSNTHLMNLALLLRNLAFYNKSKDNISVMVIQYNGNKNVSSSQVTNASSLAAQAAQ